MNRKLIALTTALIASVSLAAPTTTTEDALLQQQAVTTLGLSGPFSTTAGVKAVGARDLTDGASAVRDTGHVAFGVHYAQGNVMAGVDAEHAWGVLAGNTVTGMVGYDDGTYRASVTHVHPIDGATAQSTKAELGAQLLSSVAVSADASVDSAMALTDANAGVTVQADSSSTVTAGVSLGADRTIDGYSASLHETLDNGSFHVAVVKDPVKTLDKTRITGDLKHDLMVSDYRVQLREGVGINADATGASATLGTTVGATLGGIDASVSADTTLAEGSAAQIDLGAAASVYGEGWSTGVLADAAYRSGPMSGHRENVVLGWGHGGHALTVAGRAVAGSEAASNAITVDVNYNRVMNHYALRSALGTSVPAGDLSAAQAYATLGGSYLLDERFGLGVSGGVHHDLANKATTPVFGIEGSARLSDNAWLTAGYNVLGSDTSVIGVARKGAYVRMDLAFVNGAFR